MSREPRRENACAGEARGDGPLRLDVLCEQMAEFLSLGLQVALVLDGSAYYEWNALFDHYGRRFDCRHLLRVVGEQANSPYSKLEEHCDRWPVLPRVNGQTKGTICADGIMSGVLQSVGAYLVSEADPSTLLSAQVDQDPGARLDDPPQRFIELGTAITAQRT